MSDPLGSIQLKSEEHRGFTHLKKKVFIHRKLVRELIRWQTLVCLVCMKCGWLQEKIGYPVCGDKW